MMDPATRTIVTGADQPLGAAAAVGLRRRGAAVVPVDVAPMDRTAACARIDAAIAELGGLDVLVISGWYPPALQPRPFEMLDDADFEGIWERGMQGMLWSMQAAIPHLRESCGNIVVLVPTTGMSGGSQFGAAAATFEAQRILMKAAARQLGPDGIRVNAVAVAPELVLADAESAEVHYLAPSAIAQEASADDVCDIVAFVVGHTGRHLCGQTITIDGGRWLAP